MPTETEMFSTPLSPVPTGGILAPMLRVAVRRGKLIAVTALIVAIAASLTALLLPKHYTSTLVILPPRENNTAGAALMSQLGALGAIASMGGGLSLKNPNDLQVSLLKSRTVEDAMAARFHFQQLYHRKSLTRARKRWEQHTSVENGLKDGLIRLSVTDSDPHRAAELAEGWLDEYRHLTATLAIDEAAQRRLFFEGQLSAAKDELKRAEEDLKQTEQRTGVIEIEGQARAMIESAAILRAQLAAKQVEIQAMRQFATDQNPDLERAEQESASLASQLASMDVEHQRSEGDLIDPKGSMTENGLEYVRALREMKYRETMYQLLARQYEVARVDEARQGSLIQVVDAAEVPDRPDSHIPLLIFFAGILAAFPLGIGVALGKEFYAIFKRQRLQSGSWPEAFEALLAGGAQ